MSTHPNLFIIGAPKSATTTLYDALSAHPAVYMSPRKEPHYLALRDGVFVSYEGYENGMETIRSHPLPVHTEKDYRALFEEIDDEPVRGEASTLYLYSKYAPERIAHRSPEARIIVMLRHPVDRAYSQFLHHIRDTHETTTDFVEAFQNEADRLERGPFWHYRRMGKYYEQLRRYYDRFPNDQIQVHLLKDLVEGGPEFWGRLSSFLCIDSNIDFASTKQNKTGVPRNRLIHEILSLPWRFPMLREVVQLIPDSIRKKLSSLRQGNLSKPELDSDVRSHLTSRYFAEDIKKLQALIDRDLTRWV